MCHSEEGQKEKKEMEAKWGKKKNNNWPLWRPLGRP
jgi:hypothetical protein